MLALQAFADPLAKKALVGLASLSGDLARGFHLCHRETNRELAKYAPRANTRSQLWAHLHLDELKLLQVDLRRIDCIRICR
jgi:hypothetical protein